MNVAPLRVLHVLPRDLSRGAQVFARALVDQLDGDGAEHGVMTLFATDRGVLRPDHSLGVTPGRLRALGYDPRVPLALVGALRRLSPDVVVTHGGEALLYVAPVLPRRTPLVHKRIGTASESLTPLRLRLHRAALRRAAAVAVVSQEILGETASIFGVPPERLHLVPNGRDPSVYRPGGRRMGDGSARLLFVGELEPAKHPHRFVELVRRLRGEGWDVSGQMAGTGPLASELAEPAHAAGVELLGRRSDVPGLLASADVVCLTSEREGMPGVLIEAGLAGLPTVTTDVSGARSIVEDGVSGFVVGVDDQEAFLEATRRLVRSAELRDRMGAAAREGCLLSYTIEASAQRWRDVLDQVSAARRPRPSGQGRTVRTARSAVGSRGAARRERR